MKCEKCGEGMPQNKTLHRMNEKGVDGIWRCEECMTPEDWKKVDPETKRLTDAISGR